MSHKNKDRCVDDLVSIIKRLKPILTHETFVFRSLLVSTEEYDSPGCDLEKEAKFGTDKVLPLPFSKYGVKYDLSDNLISDLWSFNPSNLRSLWELIFDL